MTKRSNKSREEKRVLPVYQPKPEFNEQAMAELVKQLISIVKELEKRVVVLEDGLKPQEDSHLSFKIGLNNDR